MCIPSLESSSAPGSRMVFAKNWFGTNMFPLRRVEIKEIFSSAYLVTNDMDTLVSICLPFFVLLLHQQLITIIIAFLSSGMSISLSTLVSLSLLRCLLSSPQLCLNALILPWPL
ncbi:transmembrane protein, putative [Medicago truncatula]|uniref:Transmembrane protein, putative n=1 Tax=Medicago truncatula TaxID=3880 RepID=A0A072THZ0_MEDTR|nr:transmembrane protein, putative [Medicago truncatula]